MHISKFLWFVTCAATLVIGTASAQVLTDTSTIYLDVSTEVPIRLSVTDRRNAGKVIFSTQINGSRRFALPMALNCRRRPNGPYAVQRRHVLIEAFAVGKRYSQSVSGNFCEEDDDGIRLISVDFCKISKYCNESNRLSAHQVTVHAS